jgi:hypothetical protein
VDITSWRVGDVCAFWTAQRMPPSCQICCSVVLLKASPLLPSSGATHDDGWWAVCRWSYQKLVLKLQFVIYYFFQLSPYCFDFWFFTWVFVKVFLFSISLLNQSLFCFCFFFHFNYHSFDFFSFVKVLFFKI